MRSTEVVLMLTTPEVASFTALSNIPSVVCQAQLVVINILFCPFAGEEQNTWSESDGSAPRADSSVAKHFVVFILVFNVQHCQ